MVLSEIQEVRIDTMVIEVGYGFVRDQIRKYALTNGYRGRIWFCQRSDLGDNH